MRKILAIIFIFLSVASCNNRQTNLSVIDKKFQHYLRNELELEITATGRINHGEGLQYMVRTEKKFDIHQSRVYVLKCLNDFYKIVEKNNPELLKNRPLSKLVKIIFAFGKNKHERQPPPNIAAVFFF